jgi:hypothetical protein
MILVNKSLAPVHPGNDTGALRAPDKVLNLNPRDKETQSRRALIVRKMGQVSDTGSWPLELFSILVFSAISLFRAGVFSFSQSQCKSHNKKLYIVIQIFN